MNFFYEGPVAGRGPEVEKHWYNPTVIASPLSTCLLVRRLRRLYTIDIWTAWGYYLLPLCPTCSVSTGITQLYCNVVYRICYYSSRNIDRQNWSSPSNNKWVSRLYGRRYDAQETRLKTFILGNKLHMFTVSYVRTMKRAQCSCDKTGEMIQFLVVFSCLKEDWFFTTKAMFHATVTRYPAQTCAQVI